MYLLDRRGKVLSKATDQAKAESPSGPSPVHRMEFSIESKSLYILAQNLFSFASLYLINPKRKADLIYITTVKLRYSAVQWALIPVPNKQGQMISVDAGGHHLILQICLKYDTKTDEDK